MNWDDLRVFLAVGRGQSLSVAGKQLRLDPATVSRRLARFERQIGAALFVKSVSGHDLTEAGLRLIPAAEQAEAAFALAQDSLSNVQSGPQGTDSLSGTLRIGAPDGCANFVLPRVVAGICATHPDLDIQILALPRVVNLTRREADLAVTVSPPTGGRLMVKKICDYHLHLAGHRDYLEQHGTPQTLTDLKSHRIIGYIPDMIFDKELDYQSALDTDRVALTSNSVAVQLRMIAQGAGLGITHDFALPFAMDVQSLLLEQIALKRSFYLVRHEADKGLRRMDRLAALIHSGMSAEIARLEANALTG